MTESGNQKLKENKKPCRRGIFCKAFFHDFHTWFAEKYENPCKSSSKQRFLSVSGHVIAVGTFCCTLNFNWKVRLILAEVFNKTIANLLTISLKMWYNNEKWHQNSLYFSIRVCLVSPHARFFGKSCRLLYWKSSPYVSILSLFRLALDKIMLENPHAPRY